MVKLVKNNLKRIKYSSLQYGRQHILYLQEIADFSHGIGYIFKAVIGQYNLQLYSCTLTGKNNVRLSTEGRSNKGFTPV